MYTLIHTRLRTCAIWTIKLDRRKKKKKKKKRLSPCGLHYSGKWNKVRADCREHAGRKRLWSFVVFAPDWTWHGTQQSTVYIRKMSNVSNVSITGFSVCDCNWKEDACVFYPVGSSDCVGQTCVRDNGLPRPPCLILPICSGDRRVSAQTFPSVVWARGAVGQLGRNRPGQHAFRLGGSRLQSERGHDVAHLLFRQLPVLVPAAGAGQG